MLNQDLANEQALQAIREALTANQPSTPGYFLTGGCLLYNNILVIPKHSKLIPLLLKECHDSVIGGHSDEVKTYRRLAADFSWVGMTKVVTDYVKSYEVSQKNKHLSMSPAGQLQPLQLPEKVWEDLSMDFTEGLPKSEGCSVMYVNSHSKYANFIPLKHPYTTTVAEKFVINTIKL